jgi:hypothetical protein
MCLDGEIPHVIAESHRSLEDSPRNIVSPDALKKKKIVQIS